MAAVVAFNLLLFAFNLILLAIAFLLCVSMVIEWGYKKIKQAFVFLFSGFSKEIE